MELPFLIPNFVKQETVSENASGMLSACHSKLWFVRPDADPGQDQDPSDETIVGQWQSIMTEDRKVTLDDFEITHHMIAQSPGINIQLANACAW